MFVFSFHNCRTTAGLVRSYNLNESVWTNSVCRIPKARLFYRERSDRFVFICDGSTRNDGANTTTKRWTVTETARSSKNQRHDVDDGHISWAGILYYEVWLCTTKVRLFGRMTRREWVALVLSGRLYVLRVPRWRSLCVSHWIFVTTTMMMIVMWAVCGSFVAYMRRISVSGVPSVDLCTHHSKHIQTRRTISRHGIWAKLLCYASDLNGVRVRENTKSI